MFKLNPKPTFVAAVPLSVPGLSEPLEVLFTFKHKGKEALGKWVATATQKMDAEALSEVVCDWAGVKDEDGKDVPYTLTALSDLLENYSASQGEIFRAYLRELTEAKRKN